MTVLDHLAYITFRPYRRKAHAAIRKLVHDRPDGVSNLTVLHEHNDSCCRREPWTTTRAKLLQALADDGLSTLLVATDATTGRTAP